MNRDILLQKAEEFLESRKYSNNLVDILHYMDNENDISSATLALKTIFLEILKRRTMLINSTCDESQVQVASKYISWLRTCYKTCWNKLLAAVSLYENKHAVSTLFELLREEGKCPISTPIKGKYFFPEDKLERIVHAMALCNQSNKPLLKFIDKYTNYIDVVYYMWIKFPTVIASVTHPEEIVIKNVLSFLENLPIPSEEELKSQEEAVIFCFAKNKAKFRPSYVELQKSVTLSWNYMTRWPHSTSTHKQLLLLLTESILPHLVQPVLTLDYLMESLNIGGPIALLALQGIFILVKDHNLEHPNIFSTLYNLFDLSILQTKHKSRLFQLANIFMSSTHLPELLVASFAKRMSRLCLHASPQNIIIMAAFVGNLMIRHPCLKIMIHHPTGGDVSSDPFLENERDPMKTNALESSLWELQSLQHHVLPKVSKAVEFINRPLPQIEWDLSALLNYSYNEVFERESKKKIQRVSITFERPKSLSMPRTNFFTDLWALN